MKYHWSTKLTAFVIATVFLLAAVSSGIGIACLAVTGLYSQSLEEVIDRQITSETHSFACIAYEQEGFHIKRGMK